MLAPWKSQLPVLVAAPPKVEATSLEHGTKQKENKTKIKTKAYRN
jgi:hypothetical protein